VPPNFIAIFAKPLIPRVGLFAPVAVAAYIDGDATGLNPKESGPGNRKIGMESKTFSDNGAAAIIKAVNDWLAEEPGLTVRKTESHEGEAGRMTFTVWYDRETQ
jgi:hypothetical protein